MAKTKEKESGVMHFTIEGAWLTWFLRHQWIEGNEEKAIKTWEASFPELAGVEHINGYFLQVVTGKKKFEGENTFELKDDNQKFWSTTQDGEPNENYPLFDCWEDVLERKGIELFKAELDLRDIRLTRNYAPTRKGNGFRADKWEHAAKENGAENRCMKKMADLLATITNICARTGLKYIPIAIPNEGTLWEDKSKRDTKWPSRQVKHNPSLDNNKRFHAAVLGVLEPAREKFKNKYGVEVVFYDYDDIALLCGVDGADRWTPKAHDVLTYDIAPKIDDGGVRIVKPKKEPMSFQEGLDKALKQAFEEGDTERVLQLQGFKSGLAVPQSIIPGLDLEKHIDNLLKSDARTSIEAEEVDVTEWTSGYIAPDGKFYGCADIQHREFSKDLVEKFKLLPRDSAKPGWLKAKRGEPTAPPDCEIIMDRAGFVRISVNRFFWDRDHCHITKEQFVTIKDYMNAKKMEKAVFNDPTKLVTFKEGLEDA